MKNNSQKIKGMAKILLIVACIYAAITLFSFISTMSSYTSQGYPMMEVIKYLFPSQFLPTVVQPLVLMSALAYLINCVGDMFEKAENNFSELSAAIERKQDKAEVEAPEEETAEEETAEAVELAEEEDMTEEVEETEAEESEEAAEEEEPAEETLESEEEDMTEEPEETEAEVETEETEVEEEPEEAAEEEEPAEETAEPEEEKELGFKTDLFGITTIGLRDEIEVEEDTDDEIIESLDLNPAEIEISVLKNGITNISSKEPVVNVDVNKKGIYTISRK